MITDWMETTAKIPYLSRYITIEQMNTIINKYKLGISINKDSSETYRSKNWNIVIKAESLYLFIAKHNTVLFNEIDQLLNN